MRKTTKRVIAVAAVTVVLLGGAGAAFAYWTSTGSGSGTGTTGTNAAVSVNQTSTISGIVPGSAAQTLSGTFTNTNTSPVYVATVTASIASVTPVSGTCTASDYTLANAVMTVNAEIPAGTGVGSWTGATIAFNDKPAVNQDGCKGATVTFAYTVS